VMARGEGHGAAVGTALLPRGDLGHGESGGRGGHEFLLCSGAIAAVAITCSQRGFLAPAVHSPHREDVVPAPVDADLGRRSNDAGASRCGLGASARGWCPSGRCPRPLVGRKRARLATTEPALRGLAVSREQLGATVLSGHADDADSGIAVLSSTRLWLSSGWPLTLVTEQICAKFLVPTTTLAHRRWNTQKQLSSRRFLEDHLRF
jgi:hypothetical protein